MSAAIRAWPLAILLMTAGESASAGFEISGSFTAETECQAFASIRKRTNPGGVVTIPGQSYEVRALNSERGEFVHLEVPGATPGQRWVHLGCGELRRQVEDPPTPGETDAELLPFFDDRDLPDDPTPPAPTLSAFDTAVLALCGGWGSHPTRDAFRALLDEAAHEAVIGRIYRALGYAVFDSERPLDGFKDELARAWFDAQGFAHIFCGEPSSGSLGGLHFAGRYLQMQQQAWGGLAPDCAKTEIMPPVYTFGVRYRMPQGGFREACPKGYPLNLDAAEILIEATRALKLMLPRGGDRGMCLYDVAQAGAPSYLAVFVIKNRAVRTFYPDASPSCDGNRPPAACLCTP